MSDGLQIFRWLMRGDEPKELALRYFPINGLKYPRLTSGRRSMKHAEADPIPLERGKCFSVECELDQALITA